MLILGLVLVSILILVLVLVFFVFVLFFCFNVFDQVREPKQILSWFSLCQRTLDDTVCTIPFRFFLEALLGLAEQLGTLPPQRRAKGLQDGLERINEFFLSERAQGSDVIYVPFGRGFHQARPHRCQTRPNVTFFVVKTEVFTVYDPSSGSSQEVFNISRFESGRVRRCPTPLGAGRVRSGDFPIPRVTLTRPDPTRAARSDLSRETRWLFIFW